MDDLMPTNNHATAIQPQPQTVYIVLQASKTSDKEHYTKVFPKRIVHSLCAAQIFIFFVALVSEITVIVHMDFLPPDGAVGIWGGFFFGMAGAVGLLAAWRTTTCSVVGFMVMSIVAAFFTIPVMIWSGVAVGSVSYRYRGEVQEKTVAAFCSMVLVCGVTELVIAVTCSVICCRASCCRHEKTSSAVVYNPTQSVETGHAVVGNLPRGAIAVPLVQNEGNVNVPKEFPPSYDAFAHGETPSDSGDHYHRFH